MGQGQTKRGTVLYPRILWPFSSERFQHDFIMCSAIQHTADAFNRMAPSSAFRFPALDESTAILGVMLPAVVAGAQTNSLVQLVWICSIALCAEIWRQKLYEARNTALNDRGSKQVARWVSCCDGC